MHTDGGMFKKRTAFVCYVLHVLTQDYLGKAVENHTSKGCSGRYCPATHTHKYIQSWPSVAKPNTPDPCRRGAVDLSIDDITRPPAQQAL